MSFLHRLLYLLGFRQDPTPHAYNLNPDLQILIADLAQQEQRSPEEITEQLLGQALRQRQTDSDLLQRWQSLSPREQQVAALACLDYTNAEISSQLGVSIDTIKSHLRNIFAKFAINSRKELKLLLSNWDFENWIHPTSGG